MTAEEIVHAVMGNQSNNTSCSVPDCNHPIRTKLLCVNHYMKAYRWLNKNKLELVREYKLVPREG